MSNQVLRGTGFRVLWEIKPKNQKQEKNQIKKQQKVENVWHDLLFQIYIFVDCLFRFHELYFSGRPIPPWCALL